MVRNFATPPTHDFFAMQSSGVQITKCFTEGVAEAAYLIKGIHNTKYNPKFCLHYRYVDIRTTNYFRAIEMFVVGSD